MGFMMDKYLDFLTCHNLVLFQLETKDYTGHQLGYPTNPQSSSKSSRFQHTSAMFFIYNNHHKQNLFFLLVQIIVFSLQFYSHSYRNDRFRYLKPSPLHLHLSMTYGIRLRYLYLTISKDDRHICWSKAMYSHQIFLRPGLKA